jgi:hypothetical protein
LKKHITEKGRWSGVGLEFKPRTTKKKKKRKEGKTEGRKKERKKEHWSGSLWRLHHSCRTVDSGRGGGVVLGLWRPGLECGQVPALGGHCWSRKVAQGPVTAGAPSALPLEGSFGCQFFSIVLSVKRHSTLREDTVLEKTTGSYQTTKEVVGAWACVLQSHRAPKSEGLGYNNSKI